MAKHVIAEDEQGFHWIIFPEDPAWPLISKLPKTTSYYALARKSLRSGEPTEVEEPFFYSQNVPDELLSPELKAVIIRQERIYQSNQYLKEKYVH